MIVDSSSTLKDPGNDEKFYIRGKFGEKSLEITVMSLEESLVKLLTL